MSPKEIVKQWVDAFNKNDAAIISNFYSENAVNHQVAEEPVTGKENIKNFFTKEFSRAKMTCIVENIFQDGEWAILEWKDPIGLRGCGFFQIQSEKIIFQRGYWDKLSFLRAHKLPIPLDNVD
jgi:limonene-1,2-epoxide hydrolase